MKKKLLIWIPRCLLYLLVGLLIGSAVYTTASKNLSGDRLPMPLGIGTAVVLSGSMSPTFEAGDVVVVLKTQKVDVDDIVVFQRYEEGQGVQLICHRVKAIDPETGLITTRGDFNNTDDAPIERGDIKGKVLFWIPKAGFAVDIIKSPIGTLILIALAVLLLNRSFRKEEEILPNKDAEELEALRREIEALSEELKDQNDQNQS